MKLKFFGVATVLCATVAVSSAQETTVNWGNFSANPTTQNSILLRDENGVPLSQGSAGTNSDGTLVQLGYFVGSNTTGSNNFLGTWTPITGSLTSTRTSIGDSFDLSGSGNGEIDFTTFFVSGGNQPFVYDPMFSGAYQTQSSITITDITPPNGQVLAIRFYDSADTSGNYNTVSADNWLWQSPNTPGGGQLNISLATNFTSGPALEFESVAIYGITGSEFLTVIPEPSTYALVLTGITGLAFARRRLKRV